MNLIRYYGREGRAPLRVFIALAVTVNRSHKYKRLGVVYRGRHIYQELVYVGMIATSILTILALKSVFKFSSTQAIVSTALLNICVDQNTIFSCHISILLCELLFEVLYSSCDAAHNNRGKTSSVYYICCPMGWYRHCLELSSNFCTNATLYGHEVQFLRYIMRIILDITTFIGVNRYRLSFIVSFMLIGLTVACRKVVATCCAKKMM